jgi:hypothetical protein
MTARGCLLTASVAAVLVAALSLGIHQLQVAVSEISLQPQFVSPQVDRAVTIGFTWTASGYCAGQFRVNAIETATQVRVGNVMSRSSSGGGCAGIGTVDNVGWVALRLAAPVGSRAVIRDSDGSVLSVVAPATRLACTDSIASRAKPPADQSTLFGQVALPTGAALQANRSGELDPSGRLFAKTGLYVASGASLSLIVPAEWIGRLTIGWGSPAQRTNHLYVQGCKASESQMPWLVFAGGFWVGEPSCVSLLVSSAAAQEQKVQIGVGAACPGQAAPAPGSLT